MADKIKVRAGLAADRPVLDIRELGFDTDTRKLWIGSSIGNVQVATSTQEPWIAPTLFNGWVNFDAGRPSQYFKDNIGMVHLTGLVKFGTIGAVIFTLPAGYRPGQQLHLVTNSNGSFGAIEIYTDGSVVLTTGSNVSFSLTVAAFRAEQ